MKLLKILGVILLIDGIGSMVVFHDQDPINHVPRLIRALIGLVLLFN